MKVNFSKSVIVPINTPADKMVGLANTLGYTSGSLPFTYLAYLFTNLLGKWLLAADVFTPLGTPMVLYLLSFTFYVSGYGVLESFRGQLAQTM